MKDKVGTIFNIQRYMTHDGSGIRTNVFFKGCPLRCLWCSNPESQQLFPEMSFNPVKCMNCGICIRSCKTGALTSLESWDRGKCVGCGRCASLCPGDARKFMGKDYTVNELMDIVLKDVDFFRTSSGGITFSGGEPLMQAEFAAEAADALKSFGVNVAIETSGYAEWERARSVLSRMDTVLMDIKHMDSATHKRLTGVENGLILDNAAKTAMLGLQLIIRVPVIGGYNSEEENIRKTAAFASDIGVRQLHLLPYHRLGESKYAHLGRSYPASEAFTPSDNEMTRLKDISEGYGLDVRIGG